MSPIPPGLHRQRKIPFELSTEKVSFKFGTRRITAIGSAADKVHPNVRRLRIELSTLTRIIATLVALLPKLAQARLRQLFPEWCLPSAIVLKCQKPGWEDEFNNELVTYKALLALQGVAIPEHYGVVEYKGVRSHILSDIGGLSLSETDECSQESVPVVKLMLQEALTTVAEQGFLPDDLKLDNFHVVGDKMVMVDLEQFDRYEDPEDALGYVDGSVFHLMTRYRNYQNCLMDGVPF